MKDLEDKINYGFFWIFNGEWFLPRLVLRSETWLSIDKDDLYVLKETRKLPINDIIETGYPISKLHIGRKFRLTVISNCNIPWMGFSRSEFQQASIYGTDMQGAILIKSKMQQASLIKVDFRDAKLHMADLRETDLKMSNLQGADLYHADLSDALLIRTKMQKTNLKHAKLQGANLSGANLYKANLQEADLAKANLQKADLLGANLQGADLQDTEMQDVNLWRVDLRGANLSRANLQDADLWGASLQSANLWNTRLIGASLEEVQLQGAILEKTIFRKEDIDKLSRLGLSNKKLDKRTMLEIEKILVSRIKKIEQRLKKDKIRHNIIIVLEEEKEMIQESVRILRKALGKTSKEWIADEHKIYQ